MKNIFYVIAAILVIGWLVGAFFSTMGSVIHFVLVLAIVSAVIGAMRRRVTN